MQKQNSNNYVNKKRECQEKLKTLNEDDEEAAEYWLDKKDNILDKDEKEEDLIKESIYMY